MRCLLVTSFSRDLETQVQEMNFYRNLQGPPVRAGMQSRFLWVGCPPRGKSSGVATTLWSLLGCWWRISIPSPLTPSCKSLLGCCGCLALRGVGVGLPRPHMPFGDFDILFKWGCDLEHVRARTRGAGSLRHGLQVNSGRGDTEHLILGLG